MSETVTVTATTTKRKPPSPTSPIGRNLPYEVYRDRVLAALAGQAVPRGVSWISRYGRQQVPFGRIGPVCDRMAREGLLVRSERPPWGRPAPRRSRSIACR